MTRAEPVVATEHLSRWYGEVSALRDVTVQVPGGITALLGPNGAGKSTLLKLVTGQVRPSSGRVRVLGEPVAGNPGIYRRLGWCPEHDGFYESMTGLEWVSALLALQGWEAAGVPPAARRAIAAVGLEEVAGRRIGTYSRGMRQRIKLAQAIAHEPDLLVLDEPFAGLDPVSRRQAMALVRGWATAGRSVLLSSHVLHEVEAITGSIVLMHHGRVLAEGNIHDVRGLIDAQPHRVRVRAGDPRGLARHLLAHASVLGVRLDGGQLTVETSAPDGLFEELTALAADGACGGIDEVSSPDDNLQAVFTYLVKP